MATHRFLQAPGRAKPSNDFRMDTFEPLVPRSAIGIHVVEDGCEFDPASQRIYVSVEGEDYAQVTLPELQAALRVLVAKHGK